MAPYALIAMTSEARAAGFLPVVEGVGLVGQVFTDVEQLLYHTRGTNVPDALLLDHGLTERVPSLELVTLLRRRKGFEDVPFLYLGPATPELQTRVLEGGADAYITLPTRPELVKAYLGRLLERRMAESAMRKAFEGARRFEQAYKESERMKDDLIHMLVHDLKSPISSVMGLLEHSLEMLRGQGGDHDVEELLKMAQIESHHLLNLAANILDVRRMKEGHMPYQPETIASLTELAKAALADVSGGPRDRNFGFLVRPEAEQVFGDPKLLRRILANLMANAIKHTRRGGYIDFRAWSKDGNVVLSVRDDGEGIPESDQKRIFNAFEQSRHTIHDRYDTGMGLTFCKLAVEKHGGRIWVESKVGRGSTFYFTLPERVPTVVGGA